MRFTLSETISVIANRFRLFLNGDKTGVSIWWISNYMKIHNGVDGISFGSYRSSSKRIDSRRSIIKDIDKSLQNDIAPEIWNAGNNLKFFLYDYISSNNLETILETGVANGATTRIIQSAINSKSTNFHSIDINKECFAVNAESDQWTFHHLKGSNLKQSMNAIVDKLPKIDLWVHDSDHHYVWQKFEYQLAWKKLKPGGILISDDIDFSKAWCELSEINDLNYICAVFDGRKMFGIAQKNHNENEL